MRTPERVTYIILSVYLLTRTSPIRHKIDHTQVNLIKLKTFELKLDFVEYIQYTDVQIFAWPLIYHLSNTVAFVYINLHP